MSRMVGEVPIGWFEVWISLFSTMVRLNKNALFLWICVFLVIEFLLKSGGQIQIKDVSDHLKTETGYKYYIIRICMYINLNKQRVNYLIEIISIYCTNRISSILKSK